MRRFLISAVARSGSTSLREALDRHPSVLCHGEVLALQKVRTLSRHLKGRKLPLEALPAMRKNRPQAFLDLIFPTDGPTVQGAKVIHHQTLHAPNAVHLQWFADQGAAVILLWRRNLLRRWRSEFVMRHDLGLVKPELWDVLRPAMIRSECRREVAQAQLVAHALLQGPAPRALCLDFEALLSGPGALGRVHAFLEVEPSDAPLPHESGGWAKGDRSFEGRLDEMLAAPELEPFADVPAPYLASLRARGIA